jgi:hypothetical protein
MGKSFLRTDFSRWLFQQEKEDRSGEVVVQQGHRKEAPGPGNYVPTGGVISQVVQERRLDGIGKVESVAGAGCLREVYDRFGEGSVGDSTSVAHPAHDLAGTVSPGEVVVEEESLFSTIADSGSKKAVSFGLIQVREYNRVVGDNPTVRVGPPMSIGWEFVQKQAVPVDDYEKIKRPRTSDLRIMGSITRKSILRYEFDVSLEDIRAAEKMIQKIQRQRCRTVQQGKLVASIEYAMELAKRRIHRIFIFK